MLVRPIVPGLVAQYCTGQGLEIGAGLIPYCSRSNTTFLDKNFGIKEATENADIIADAWEIPRPDESFNFVFSSHVLEHMPNAIRALKEWIRVLKPGGVVFTMLPHAERTIDKHRPVTSLVHLIQDYENGIGHEDRTHFGEMKTGWSKLEDFDNGESFEREWGAHVWDWEFRIAHGVLHYHVWTEREIVELYRHLGLDVLEV